MKVSLNQIEQTARKAARGAGLAWGLADEVGRAMRWLHAYGLNGAALLAAHLDGDGGDGFGGGDGLDSGGPGGPGGDFGGDGDNEAGGGPGSGDGPGRNPGPPAAPLALTGVWRAAAGPLDPLATGASISDCIDAMPRGGIQTAAIARPLLAAAFVGGAAESEGLAFEVTWRGCVLRCARGRVQVRGALDAALADSMHCRPAEPRAPAFRGPFRAPRLGETTVDAHAWSRLNRHARRTHVPATPASRQTGAGAGLRDND
ncbi:MAG: DUF3726 domain-containing protein [Gammaproteobacteria bacterium]|nr:DUF3726 domain-containing protein [Gammaproteobacteria bacterium]